MKDSNKKAEKKHADFQSKYRKSSNFPSTTSSEADILKPIGDGKVIVKNSNSEEE